MKEMFNRGTHLYADLGKWDVSRVTNMHSTFTFSSGLFGNLSKWDVSRVTDMSYMFAWSYPILRSPPEPGSETDFNGDLSKWDVSDVANTAGMFDGDSCALCDRVPFQVEQLCREK